MKTTSILVVDSDPKNLQILRESLESYNFRVTTVDNGIDAWGIIRSQTPDMIICEVDIPGITGFELQERLQKHSVYASLPIVFLTNRRNLEDRLRSLRSGVKDYMIKPLHVKEVIARIQMILRRMERIKSESTLAEKTESGSLEEKSIEDLIESFGLDRKSGVLTVYDENNRNGEIYFRDGMVVNARLDNFRAEKAVYQMLAWKHGRYTMTFKEVNVEEEITVSNLGLLLQGFKRLQDRENLVEKIPSLQAVFVKTPIFEQVLQKKTVSMDASKFISLFDGKRTVDQILSESVYDDIKTLQKTVQLYEQGFIEPRDGERLAKRSERSEFPDAAEAPTQPSSAVPRAEIPEAEMPPPEPQAPPEPQVPPEPKPPEPEKPVEEPQRWPSFDIQPEEPPAPKPSVEPEPSEFEESTRPPESTAEPSPSTERMEPEAAEESEVENGRPAEHVDYEREIPEETAAFEDAIYTDLPAEDEPTEEPAREADRAREESLDQGTAFTSFYDALFNGNTSESGHLAIIGSDDVHRKELISTLTAGDYSVKKIGEGGVQSTELGRIVTPKHNTLDIVGLPSDKFLLTLLTQMSTPMLGYVVLIAADRTSNLGYWGYLLNSLKKKFSAPHTVAVCYSDEKNRVSLDIVRHSLRIGEEESLIQLQVGESDSVQLLLEKLQAARASSRKSSEQSAT